MALINKEQAYQTLSEYYHHTGTLQHIALKEALDRIPVVDAVPVEWIMEYTEENPLYQSDDFDLYIHDMIADWREENEID